MCTRFSCTFSPPTCNVRQTQIYPQGLTVHESRRGHTALLGSSPEYYRCTHMPPHAAMPTSSNPWHGVHHMIDRPQVEKTWSLSDEVRRSYGQWKAGGMHAHHDVLHVQLIPWQEGRVEGVLVALHRRGVSRPHLLHRGAGSLKPPSTFATITGAADSMHATWAPTYKPWIPCCCVSGMPEGLHCQSRQLFLFQGLLEG